MQSIWPSKRRQYRRNKTVLSTLVIFLIVLIVSILSYGFYRSNEPKQVFDWKTLTASQAVLDTDYGQIEIVFLKDKAPLAIAGFVKLAQDGKFDGADVSRLTKEFVQLGTMSTTSAGVYISDSPNGEKMVRGSVATVSLGNNSTSTEFFVVRENSAPWLEKTHAVFGKILVGMDVIDKIAKQSSDKNGKPLKPIKINKDLIIK
ncbi:MAG: peptidylprolyl isomerase [bacterium]